MFVRCAVTVMCVLGMTGCVAAAPEHVAQQAVGSPPAVAPVTAAATEAGEPSLQEEPVVDDTAVAVTEDSADSETTPVFEEPPVHQVGSEGESVRDLQHRLLQIGWYSGEITGEFDESTLAAVEGFQAKRGLPVLGYVDQATMDRLVEMTRQPTYEEMHNILVAGPALLQEGDSGDNVKELQARLKQIRWYDALIDGNYGPQTVEAVSGFQSKREIPVTGEVDQRTLDLLHAMTRQPTDDELNNRTALSPTGGINLDPRCLTGRVLCISKASRTLAWVIDGQIQTTMDARFGSSATPTRNGEFSVGWKSRDHVSTIYHTAMPYAMFFSGGQAIHYSADFAAVGYNGASHGCVNVRDKAAIAALFDEVQVGDKVIVYTG